MAPKLSRSAKTAANIAASHARAQQSALASARPLTPAQLVQPGIELSPAVASMKPDQVLAAFLGKPVEQAAVEEPKEATDTEDEATTTTEPQAAENAETETETQADAEDTSEADAETETETDAEITGSNVDGIVKALAKHPDLKGIAKRVTKLVQQNAERGEKLKQAEAISPVVLAATPDHPFSHVQHEQEVDAAVQSTLSEARANLRWLSRHLDGGTWAEGTDHPVDMSAEQVEQAITYYENVTDTAKQLGEERKSYLQKRTDIAKSLDVPVSELINPKVATRESALIREVPQLMKNAEYLQILADAQAGRIAREKKARGVHTLEVDPTKATPPATVKGASVKPKTATSSTAAPAARGSSTVPVRPPNAGISLADLRARAEAGNHAAQTELARRFMAVA